jgi:hypothetical protein
MKIRQRLSLAAAAACLTLGVTVPAAAQEATPWPELVMKMADVNKDGMVTKKEYLDMAAKIWDMKHAAMMKDDKGMKAGMMTKAQFMAFVKGTYQDLGSVAAGNVGG